MISHEKIETVTGFDYTSVQLTENGLVYQTDESSSIVELSEASITLARILIENADLPVYPKRIKQESGGAIDSVADTYDELIDVCRESDTGIVNHFLKLGRFSALSRSFITETNDEARIRFARLAIMDIGLEQDSNRKIERKQKPFLEYIDLIYNGPSEQRFTTNKKIAGSVAAVVGIGAASWFVLSRTNRN